MIRIFIAEDDADDLEMFQSAIGDIEPRAIVVSAGDDAKLISNLEEHTPPLPSIIFLDINMPKKNGRECIREIKQEPRFIGVPIIILSTSTAPADVEFMYANGANCYIEKPNSFPEFKQMLKTVITNSYSFVERTQENFLIRSTM